MIEKHGDVFAKFDTSMTPTLKHKKTAVVTTPIKGESKYKSAKFLNFKKRAVNRLEVELASERGRKILSLQSKYHGGDVELARQTIMALLRSELRRKFDVFEKNSSK